jgi:hypothetical protein
MTEESKMLYIIAVSKKHRIKITDAQALYDGIKAFESMDLKGTIVARELEVGKYFGKLFQMDDATNECNDVHLVMLGDFKEAERIEMGRFFTPIVEAMPEEEYVNLSGDVLRYKGGRHALDLLMQYMKRKS